MTREQMLDDLGVAAAGLRAAGAGTIGVMGFCMGGVFTWHAALHGEGYEAAVGFYGVGIAFRSWSATMPPLCCSSVGRTSGSSSDDIAKVADHHADTIVYPQAGHGFMRDRCGGLCRGRGR